MTSPSKDSPVLSLPQGAPVAADPLRTILTSLIHETIEREFTQFVGAQRFERTPDRREVRNAFRRRQFSTRVGQLCAAPTASNMITWRSGVAPA